MIRSWRCVRMLWQILQFDVLTFLPAVTVKVAVQVRAMSLTIFALSAPILIPALHIFSLVMAGMS